MTYWSDEEDELLKALWKTGLSASQVASELAKRLKSNRSRSSVLGRVHRLGLPDHPHGPRSTGYSTRAQGLKYRQMQEDAQRKTSPKPAAPETEERLPANLLDAFKVLTPEARPWEERGLFQCAFPLDTMNGIYSCCRPAKKVLMPDGEEKHLPYCRYHCRIVYQKPKPRKTKSGTDWAVHGSAKRRAA